MLHKYNLSVFFTNYKKNAIFGGNLWKSIVVNAVGQKLDNDWQTRINLDNDFNRFKENHISVSMASVWKFLTNCSDHGPAKFVAKLISSVPNNNVPSCGI